MDTPDEITELQRQLEQLTQERDSLLRRCKAQEKILIEGGFDKFANMVANFTKFTRSELKKIILEAQYVEHDQRVTDAIRNLITHLEISKNQLSTLVAFTGMTEDEGLFQIQELVFEVIKIFENKTSLSQEKLQLAYDSLSEACLLLKDYLPEKDKES